MTDDDDLAAEDPITEVEIQREAWRQDLAWEANQLAALSGFISAVLTVVGVLGVAGGAAIVLGLGQGGDNRHLALGIAITFGSILQIGLALIFTKTAGVIAQYVRYRVERSD